MDFQLPLSNVFNYFNPPASFSGISAPHYWSALNASLHGRLEKGEPWPKPCFSWYNGKPVDTDPAACDIVQANYFNSHLNRSNAFGAFSATQFETCMFTGDECALDWTNPDNVNAFDPPNVCRQGSVADYFIDVKDAQDVKTAFKFAKETGVPLVIKNTGHDFKGRSSSPFGLALWMHHLKYIYHVPDFKPDGCPTNFKKQSVVTFGAGEQFDEIYRFAHENGLEVVGGSDQSVGAAGGWGQGGGHSSLSPTLGLGADRTVQYKVVTPDGQYRIANACQNQDLFFALRGGGGGTFGVVLEATMMASPAESLRVVNLNWDPTKRENTQKLLEVFLKDITGLAATGWGGYLTPGNGNLILTTPKVDIKRAKEQSKALVKVTESIGGSANISEVPDYYDWFSNYVQGTSGVQYSLGLPIAMTSRLIPERNHATEKGRADLLRGLMLAIDNAFYTQLMITTPFGFRGSDGSDTSVNPVWRSSLYHVLIGNTWQYNSTLTDRQQAYERSTKAVSILREITPESGAYPNESDIHEPNWQWSFFNKHYDRLVQIKRKYDPHHLLDCWQCVDWKGSWDRRYSCYI